LIRAGALKRPGLIVGAFALGYGIARASAEHFREARIQSVSSWGGLTMGTMLSVRDARRHRVDRGRLRARTARRT